MDTHRIQQAARSVLEFEQAVENLDRLVRDNVTSEARALYLIEAIRLSNTWTDVEDLIKPILSKRQNEARKHLVTVCNGPPGHGCEK